jgi:bacterial/archaeal transporter family protein
MHLLSPASSWIVFAVCSAVFLGIYDVAKKASVQDNAVLVVLFACSASGLAIFLPLGALSLAAPAWAQSHGVFIAALSFHDHALVVAKAALVTLSWILTFFALKHLPISLASPVRASAPLFTLLGAVVLFGERPSARQGLGIAVILLAYWGFSLIGRTEGIHFSRNAWVWSLFLGTLVGAASGLYDKHLLQTARLPALAMQFWFTAYNTLIQGGILVFLWVFLWRPHRALNTPFRWRWTIAAVGVLLLLSDALYFHALAMPGALVSVISTLRRTNVVLSFALGSLLFGEQYRLRKSFALAGVIAGVFLIL